MDAAVVRLLGACHDAFVHAVVDGVVDPFVHGIDGWELVLGEERSGGLAQGRVDEGVEGGVEHADDFGGLVVDNGLALEVPEGGYCEAAGVVGVRFVVKLRVLCEAIDGVAGGGAVFAVVGPAIGLGVDTP